MLHSRKSNANIQPDDSNEGIDMVHQGKCPKCGKSVLHVHIESVNGMVENETKARCLSYSCIHCFAVLGVQIDPRSKRRSRVAVVDEVKPVK